MSANVQLVNYYLLCSLAQGGRGHIIGAMTADQAAALLSRKDRDTYMREDPRGMMAKDVVIGGNTRRADRKPIIVL